MQVYRRHSAVPIRSVRRIAKLACERLAARFRSEIARRRALGSWRTALADRPERAIFRLSSHVSTLGSVADKGRSAAVIAGVSTVAAAVISGVFLLLSKDHSPSATQSTATAPVSSPTASPIDVTSVLYSPTPTPGPTTQSATQPAARAATVSGVPKQGVPDQHVTMRGSGFPRGGKIKVTFAIGPGQDFPLSFPPPQQVDSQGSFTFTFTIDSMFCGYSGQINTYDFGGDGQLLTRNPLAVVC